GRDGRAWFGNSLPTFARSIRLLGRLGCRRFCRAIRKRNYFFCRRSYGLAGGIGIVRWTFPACTLAHHAAQSQEDENCERQENDGVDVEHVSHAFGYRTRRIVRIGLPDPRLPVG